MVGKLVSEGYLHHESARLGESRLALHWLSDTGTGLVERVGRSARLTEAGAVLARHATPVLAALDAAEEEVAAIAGLRSGRVRLMAFPSASATLVPRALALVKARYPDVSITFTEACATA